MSGTEGTEVTPEFVKEVTDVQPEKKQSSEKKSPKDGKKNKKSWFSGIKAEFKKISWPDKMKVVKSTTAVVLVSIFVAIAVKVSDLLIQAVLDLLL